MKPENTLENKAKFFALYMGQIVWTNPSIYSKSIFNVNPQMLYEPSNEELLELTPLSQISDEDAIEVCKIANSPSFAIPKDWYMTLDTEYGFITIKSDKSYHSFDIDTKDGHLKMYDGDIESDAFFNHYFICDYLRSKGYALPWMGLSVEELIEYGWFVLKEEVSCK